MGRMARGVVVAAIAGVCASALAISPSRQRKLPAGAAKAIDAAVQKAMASGSPGMSVAIGDAEGMLFNKGYGFAS